jgi:hypothetical protein
MGKKRKLRQKQKDEMEDFVAHYVEHLPQDKQDLLGIHLEDIVYVFLNFHTQYGPLKYGSCAGVMGQLLKDKKICSTTMLIDNKKYKYFKMHFTKESYNKACTFIGM